MVMSTEEDIGNMDGMDDSFRGKLLIASPALVDPNFARSVVFMTEHNDDGAM